MSPSISTIRASNKTLLSALTTPTAVFVGGTSGIGRGMAEVFAQHTNGAANIIIVGRNERVAQKIIASFPKPSNTSVVHEFVKCDATSMKEIGAAAEASRSKVPKQAGISQNRTHNRQTLCSMIHEGQGESLYAVPTYVRRLPAFNSPALQTFTKSSLSSSFLYPAQVISAPLKCLIGTLARLPT